MESSPIFSIGRFKIWCNIWEDVDIWFFVPFYTDMACSHSKAAGVGVGWSRAELPPPHGSHTWGMVG